MIRTDKIRLSIKKGPVDLTPLVDVVFLLLLFFMLTKSFIVEPAIKINLPQEEKVETEPVSDLSLTVLKDGQIYCRGKRIKMVELRDFLKDVDEQSRLVIKADTNARHGIIVRIIGVAKKFGINKISIATRPLETEW
ncbi:MAG: biopolymer transporter ExbD [Chlamydiota bacterium]|nr:biopolymer transporter ExbD [Chlamydiota bacterium]